MQITILFFAQARDRAGRSSASLDLPEGSNLDDLVRAIGREHPGLAPLWPHLAVAVNGKLVEPDAAIPAGAEVALLPPVSGG